MLKQIYYCIHIHLFLCIFLIMHIPMQLQDTLYLIFSTTMSVWLPYNLAIFQLVYSLPSCLPKQLRCGIITISALYPKLLYYPLFLLNNMNGNLCVFLYLNFSCIFQPFRNLKLLLLVHCRLYLVHSIPIGMDPMLILNWCNISQSTSANISHKR